MGKARKRRTDCCPSAFYPFDCHTAQLGPDAWKKRFINPAAKTQANVRSADQAWTFFATNSESLSRSLVPERVPLGLLVRMPSIGGGENRACFAYPPDTGFDGHPPNDVLVGRRVSFCGSILRNLGIRTRFSQSSCMPEPKPADVYND